jgi:hypothetical protein
MRALSCFRKFSDLKWYKFFYEDRGVQDINYMAGLSEFNDVTRIIQTLREAADNDFNVFKDEELLKAFSLVSFIRKNGSNRGKETTFLPELCDKVIYKIEIERSIEWTPAKFDLFAKFIRNN